MKRSSFPLTLLALVALFVATGARAAEKSSVCSAAGLQAFQRFPDPGLKAPAPEVGWGDSVYEKSVAAKLTVFRKKLEAFQDESWWRQSPDSLNLCAAGKKIGPVNKDESYPSIIVVGDSGLRLVSVQDPLQGNASRYFSFLILKALPKNTVLSVPERFTRCDSAPISLSKTNEPQPGLLVTVNDCGLNPSCSLSAYRADLAQNTLRPENIFLTSSGASNETSVSGWQNPGEIDCPTLIQSGKWVDAFTYEEPNQNCQSAPSKDCPEYLRKKVLRNAKGYEVEAAKTLPSKN